MANAALARLVAAYDAEFRTRMTATPDEVADGVSCLQRARALEAPAQDLLDTLLLACGAGQPVEPRFRPRIEAVGESLWLAGFLLPRTAPSAGATVDPRYYAASCRVNPGLRRRRPFSSALPRPERALQPQFPPADATWDAVVIAAALEATPPSLNRDGSLRKDQLRRLLDRLGADTDRWSLALSYARSVGLARPAAGRLYGFPETRPRALVDPVGVLSAEQVSAGRALLRMVDEDWVSLDGLSELLRTRARDVLCSPEPRQRAYADHPGHPFDDESWTRIEEPLIRQVADVFHRTRVWDGVRDAHGLVAVRRPGSTPQLPPGFMLTPDLDILVGAGELPTADYGRLCRMAPYVTGDRVHRHKLTREGVAADLASGYDDPLTFLGQHSRTGVPGSVRQSVELWARSAERLTLFTGVTVVEQDGALKQVTTPPEGGRIIDYGGDAPPPAMFEMIDGEIRVPIGRDALSVRAAVSRVGTLKGRDDHAWRYALTPRPGYDQEVLLETLRRLHPDGELPGEMEAAVLAVHGLPACTVEEAVVIHLPERAAGALRRDRVAAQMLQRSIAPTQCIVSRTDLPALRKRFAELGIEVEA
ncbi:MAG: hypothetical protein H6739_24845 [Alphaproteobacteria bacterium]|nr:hypothetical protein [Alphaproteobacteria bacterium]